LHYDNVQQIQLIRKLANESPPPCLNNQSGLFHHSVVLPPKKTPNKTLKLEHQNHLVGSVVDGELPSGHALNNSNSKNVLVYTDCGQVTTNNPLNFNCTAFLEESFVTYNTPSKPSLDRNGSEQFLLVATPGYPAASKRLQNNNRPHTSQSFSKS